MRKVLQFLWELYQPSVHQHYHKRNCCLYCGGGIPGHRAGSGDAKDNVERQKKDSKRLNSKEWRLCFAHLGLIHLWRICYYLQSKFWPSNSLIARKTSVNISWHYPLHHIFTVLYVRWCVGEWKMMPKRYIWLDTVLCTLARLLLLGSWLSTFCGGWGGGMLFSIANHLLAYCALL